jgi:hypothetical protein
VNADQDPDQGSRRLTDAERDGYATTIVGLAQDRDRLRATLQSIARPVTLQGGLDAETWMNLAQTTARRALEPGYVADGSWSWNDHGSIRPGEPGTPVPGSMAAAIARPASDEQGQGDG